nr:carbonic anhydrase family protein [uncultured Flavobacterium sp.]
MKKFKKIILMVTVLSACYTLQAQVTTPPTNQINATAPDANTKTQQGYALPGLDHGFEQSPINIISSKSKEGKHKITLHYKDEINKIENLGHTVQLDFQEGSSITVDDTTFVFKQCHFHTPSEHLIDGQTFPAEMHIVNLLPNADKKATPQYLVIGVLFKEGKENKFIADFLNTIPKEEHETAELKVGKVKLSDLFGNVSKSIKGHYYQYRGSLTTPPFTESVRWYITKHIFEASAEQIEAINRIEGNNARHVQALYGRLISTK